MVKHGCIGIFISSFIISLVVHKVFKICNENNIETYQEFCDFMGNCSVIYKLKLSDYNNSGFANLLNNVVNIFLLISFYVMIAGFSSLLKQEFCLNGICGSMIIVVLCYLVFLRNINGLIKISNYLVPILIAFILIISLRNTNVIENYDSIINVIEKMGGSYCRAIIKSVLYACYNCIILIPVLIPLRKKVQNNKNALLISTMSFVLLIVLSFAIFNLLLQGNTEIFNLEMPIIGVVKQYGYMFKYMYIVIIAISIFTSAVSAGCGLLSNCSKNDKAYKRNLKLMCISAVFLSQISFSTMVNLIYPVLGIFGVLEIILICCREK